MRSGNPLGKPTLSILVDRNGTNIIARQRNVRKIAIECPRAILIAPNPTTTVAGEPEFTIDRYDRASSIEREPRSVLLPGILFDIGIATERVVNAYGVYLVGTPNISSILNEAGDIIWLAKLNRGRYVIILPTHARDVTIYRVTESDKEIVAIVHEQGPGIFGHYSVSEHCIDLPTLTDCIEGRIVEPKAIKRIIVDLPCRCAIELQNEAPVDCGVPVPCADPDISMSVSGDGLKPWIRHWCIRHVVFAPFPGVIFQKAIHRGYPHATETITGRNTACRTRERRIAQIKYGPDTVLHSSKSSILRRNP